MERPSQPISHCGSHRRPRGLQRQHQLPRGEGAPLPGVPDPHSRSRRPGAESSRIRRGRRHQLAPLSRRLAPRPWWAERLLFIRSLSRLGEVVDQILFERQVAQPPLPLDPKILEVLPY